MHLYRSLFILLHFLLLASTAVSQFVPVRKYTSKDGMFTDRITCITQDKDGYMWFGTYFGIMRYDGYQFQRIQLPSDMQNKFVSCIAGAGDKLYAGFIFEGGLMEWHRGKARRILFPNPEDNTISALSGNTDGSITVASRSIHSLRPSVWQYKNEKFQLLLQTNYEYGELNDLAHDKHGNLWVATDKGLLIRRPSGELKHLIKDSLVRGVKLNRNGTMVVVIPDSFNTIVHFFDTKHNRPIRKHSSSYYGITDNKIYGDNVSGYWSFGGTKGLVRVEEDGSSSSYRFPILSMLSTGQIFIDRENNKWLATEGGVIKFSTLQAQSFYFDKWSPTSAAILPLPAHKLVTNGFSVFIIQGDTIKKIDSSKSRGNIGKIFKDSRDNIWLGQWGKVEGAIRARWSDGKLIDQKHYIQYQQRLITVSDIKEELNGTIWLAGGNELFFYRKGNIRQNYKVKLEGRNLHILTFVLDEKTKHVWIGTQTGLLKLRYHENANGDYEFKLVTVLNSKNGLKDEAIRGNLLMDSKGRLWIGTRNAGLSYLLEKDGSFIIKHFSEAEGIGCSRISTILEHNNYIWVSTCDGVYKLNDSAVLAKYNSGDGLLGNDIIHIALENDTLWAATAEGITKLRLQSEPIISPQVTISDVKILGVSDSSLYYKQRTSIPYQKSSVGFVYTANSYYDERKVLYKYKLEGYDKDWSTPTPSNNINYASLAPGEYTFKVMAQNARGVWSRQPAVYTFEIVQPFYATAWFIILVLSLFLSFIFFIRGYRIKQKYKVESMRLAIARDLHDDIGSALGSINILSKTAQRRLEGESAVRDVLEKIGTTAQKTLESMDDIIWTINPAKEKATDLAMRMQNFALPLLESEGIAFSFSYEADGLQKLNMQVRRNLYLMFKELVYNAIRHAHCSKVEARLYHHNGMLVLEVKDNGIGLNGNGKSSGRNGLKNIHERVVSMGGDITVHSGEGAGTHHIIRTHTV